ncbi:MAG: histidinol dehydrogenase [Bacteroidota bacterium]
MRTYNLDTLSPDELANLCVRPSTTYTDVPTVVHSILKQVASNGDAALRELTEKFDKAIIKKFQVCQDERENARRMVPANLQEAVSRASKSIEIFHRAQIPLPITVETTPGVSCSRVWKPINNVGLYIPGGTAPLVSTLLMLGIPATIAGCRNIVVCTPPLPSGAISPSILFAAETLNIKQIYKVGGAQAIAAMALGTESIPKVDKIFGPGNRYVAAAKLAVTQPPYNIAIDVHAGPTEVLIIADEHAKPSWVAADLIAQAEHGEDSQVILVATSRQIAIAIETEMIKQTASLSRKEIVSKALEKSFSLIVNTIDQAIEFSNRYAPEHLQLAVEHPEKYQDRITSAGSVFLGNITSAVFGDYASGTNHTLPTNGAARYSGGVTVESFMKPVFFQTVTEQGLKNIAKTVSVLAEAENLDGHKNAALIRGVAL